MAYKKRLLEYDPVLKRWEWFWMDDQNPEHFVIQTVTDVSDIVEENKARYAATDERAGWKGDWHRIATVPLAIALDLLKKTNHGRDKKAVARWINDPDNRAFLTRPVKL